MAPRKAADADRRRFVWRREMETGMVRIEAQLRPEEAALVMAAIEAAQRKCAMDVSAEARGEPPCCERADAIVTIARVFLSGGKSTAPAWQAIVHLRPNEDDDAELDDGTLLSPATARRLTCDSSKITVVEGKDGNPLDVGRKTRSVPAAMRRALVLRDRGCRFPGCTNRLCVDGHHIRHWSEGGRTCLDNLLLLCTRHHRFVHEYNYTVTLGADGVPSFFDGRGRRVPPAAPPAAPNLTVPQVHAASPGWDGLQADYHACVDALFQ
jgi:hypothetical protein